MNRKINIVCFLSDIDYRLFVGCVLTALLGSAAVFSLSVLYAFCHFNPNSCLQMHPPPLLLTSNSVTVRPLITTLSPTPPFTTDSVTINTSSVFSSDQSSAFINPMSSSSNLALTTTSSSVSNFSDRKQSSDKINPPLFDSSSSLSLSPPSNSASSSAVTATESSSLVHNTTPLWWPLAPQSSHSSILITDWPRYSMPSHLFITAILVSACLSGTSMLLLAHLLSFHIFLSKPTLGIEHLY